ncbi:MAG: asparagine synthase C-terminal domain-containing protein, partial [Chloroflexota bacterium]
EIRGMLLHSNRPRAVNMIALQAFMGVGFVTSPDTMFEGVRKLPPAHYLVAKNGQITTRGYWSLSYQAAPARSEQEIMEEFYNLLNDSVIMRLMSEVPLGALLSGGIDSTTLAALMQQATAASVKTVSIGFEVGEDDETDKIMVNAAALKTDHHHTNFTGHSLDEYPKALYYMEEPLADAVFTTFYNLYRVCREAGLTVVLNGEGADELLGGYFWHRGEAWAAPFLNLPYPLRAVVAQSPFVRRRGEAGVRMGALLRAAPREVHRRYQTWLSIGDQSTGQGLLSADVRAELTRQNQQPLLDGWADYAATVTDPSDFHQMLWLQSRTRMIDRSNHMVDRMSMAHSVEARVPFLDHKLWEFCAGLPPNLKLNGSFFDLTEKYLLREATKNIIPEATRTRKKQGLSAPYGEWLAQPRLPEWAETALSKEQLRKTGLFDPEAVQNLRQAHQSGVFDQATMLMGVLSMQTWAHIFLETPLA